jgi:hypothetical protein
MSAAHQPGPKPLDVARQIPRSHSPPTKEGLYDYSHWQFAHYDRNGKMFFYDEVTRRTL